MRTLKLRLDGQGHGTIELDGKDISNLVSGIDVKMRAGRATEVVLELPGADLDVDADAEAENVKQVRP